MPFNEQAAYRSTAMQSRNISPTEEVTCAVSANLLSIAALGPRGPRRVPRAIRHAAPGASYLPFCILVMVMPAVALSASN